jgi:CubicO group peptidase (beta-lactamase class C family)
VTGKSYAEVLEERITSRIGLTDTYVATGPIDVSRNESLTYLNTGSDWKQGTETHPSVLFGAGQIVSTPNDLARFAQALFDLELLSQASLDLMTRMRDGEGSGMERFTFAGKTFYGHTGGGDNYGAWLAYLPEEKLAVAYATNAKTSITTGRFRPPPSKRSSSARTVSTDTWACIRVRGSPPGLQSPEKARRSTSGRGIRPRPRSKRRPRTGFNSSAGAWSSSSTPRQGR